MIIGLTGATGFIGKHLLNLYSSEHKFICATSKKDFSGLLHNKNIEYHFSDYSIDSLTQIFKNCNALVNLGAVRSTAENQTSLTNFFPNISSTENLLITANKLNIKNIVNISSRAVYSAHCPTPYTEDVTSPISLYGVSKLCCEELCEYYNEKYDFKIKSLRISQVIGLGERSGYLLATFLENCQNQKPLCVYGQGKLSRDFIYVKDVAKGIITALNHSEEKGIFNLGSGYMVSNLELAQFYCLAFNNKAGFKALTDKQETGDDYYLDMSKTKKQLEFISDYTIKEAIYDMKNDYEKKV